MMTGNSWRWAVFVLAVGLLAAGCSISDLYEPEPHVTSIAPQTMLSNTASVKNTYVHDPDSNVIVCAEPSPDAAFSQSESSDVTVTILSFGSEHEEMADADESAELEMAGRAPHVLLTRELMFRLCEFVRNHRLGQQAAIELYKKNLDIISQVSNTVAGNTTIKILGQTTVSETLTVDEAMKLLKSSQPQATPSGGTSQTTGSSGGATDPKCDPNSSQYDSDYALANC
jgi:hypothetical protein